MVIMVFLIIPMEDIFVVPKYHLVNIQKTMERSTMFHWKTNYKWPCSITFCMFTRPGIFFFSGASPKKMSPIYQDDLHTASAEPQGGFRGFRLSAGDVFES